MLKTTNQLLSRLRGPSGSLRFFLCGSVVGKKIVTTPRPCSPLQPVQEVPLAERDGGGGGGAGHHRPPALLAPAPRLQVLVAGKQGGEAGGSLPDQGRAGQGEGAVEGVLLDREHPGVVRALCGQRI